MQVTQTLSLTYWEAKQSQLPMGHHILCLGDLIPKAGSLGDNKPLQGLSAGLGAAAQLVTETKLRGGEERFIFGID